VYTVTGLRQGWDLIRRWLWLLTLGTVLAAAVGYGLSASMTPYYQAKATLLVNQGQGTTAMASYNDILSSERLARTYGELMRTEPIVLQVIADLQLPLRYEELVKNVDVRQVRDTQLIALAVEHPDPRTAAEIANGIARAFIGRISQDQLGQTAATRNILDRQVTDLEQQITRTTQAIEQASRVDAEGPTSSRVAFLQNELARYQTTYAQLLRSQHEMAIEAAAAANSVRLAVPATVSERPVRPNVPQRTILAAVLGLLAAAGLAFALEYLNDAVRTPEEVERVSGLHTLGSVALFGAGGRGRSGGNLKSRTVADSHGDAAMSEAFRILRTNIEFAQVDTTCRVLLVTSSSPGEGKSTVAANLAAVTAQTGRSVLLVDADLRRPTIHETLGIENRQGLTNLLVREAHPIEPVLQETRLPGVTAMTSGPIPPNPTELLGSSRMKELLARLTEMFDLVIVDSPPVLAVADPAVLAPRVDGVVLVVDARSTSSETLRRTRDALARANANMLGVVLNKLRPQGDRYYHYYGAKDAPKVDDSTKLDTAAVRAPVR
jgi:capsular exopolysaccharide synthesis family protein